MGHASRNGLVDYARFAAALGIVWLTLQVPGSTLAKIALPLFIVLSIGQSVPSVAANARRYLWPFLIWSALFGLVQLVFATKYGGAPLDLTNPELLLAGTWFHLWLLPFLFFVAVIAPWLRHPLASLGLALAVAGYLSAAETLPSLLLSHWLSAAIPALVVIGFQAWGWRLAATILVASGLLLQFGHPAPDTFAIIGGAALGIVILSYHSPSTPLSDWCGRLSFAVYLAFPLAIIIGQSLRITWVELGLFCVVGSVIMAQIIDLLARPAGSDRAGA